MTKFSKSGAEMMYQHRIHYISARLRLSGKELAARAGMPFGELKRIMESDIPNISIEQAAKLAEALGTTMNYLILGE